MRLVLIISALLGGAAAWPALADEALARRFSESLSTVLPEAQVTSVRETAVAGLYEVALGPKILYMSADGRYVFSGDLMDLQERRNLSDERRAEARVAGLREAAGAIEFAPPAPRHVIYVFTDIDCSYCRRLHQEVPELNAAGIAVRYLAFPRAGLDSDSYHKAVSVWCAADRRQALTDAKAGKAIPEARCDAPVQAQFRLGEAFGVRGTPAIYLENGDEIGGYVPAPRLIQILEGGS